jgi:hypothetical protein
MNTQQKFDITMTVMFTLMAVGLTVWKLTY